MGVQLQDVVVVGAGIVGLATALRLLEARPDLQLTVLEKEPIVGAHQSSHNSGVVHAGIYYAPGSLKARLCREGAEALERFCAAHGVPFQRTGKLVVATAPTELDRFDEIERRAEANGVPGLRALGPDELREVEPHATGIRALHSPTTAVTDFGAVTRAYADEVARRGGQLRLGAEVIAVTERDSEVRVGTSSGPVRARVVVTCAGLHADRLGDPGDARILPFRGSWWILRRPELVRGNLYPVPDPAFPFLGVHATRRVDGEVWLGPNAVLAFDREGYQRPALDLRDTWDALRHPGLWRLARRYPKAAVREWWQDRVRRAYAAAVRRYLPEVRDDDIEPGPSGIRAQALHRDGTMVEDFLIDASRRVVHVRNAPSPAATSSLAIGRLLAAEVTGRL